MPEHDPMSRECMDFDRRARSVPHGRWHFLYGTLLIAMAAVTLASHVRLQIELNAHKTQDAVLDSSVRMRRQARELGLDIAAAIESAQRLDTDGVYRFATDAKRSVNGLSAILESHHRVRSAEKEIDGESTAYLLQMESMVSAAAEALKQLSAAIDADDYATAVVPVCRGLEMLSGQMVALTDSTIVDLQRMYDAQHRHLTRSSLALAAFTALLFSAYAGLMLGPVARTLRSQLRELERARSAAMDGIRAKSEFLANVTHELRTPLTSILGYAELLRNPTLHEDERSEYAGIIHSSGTQLLQLINDLLDLSKLDAGKLALSTLACSPADLAAQTVRILKPAADRKRLTLDCIVHDGVPDRIVSDPDRLRQVLVNLVGNAVKFTFSGGVRLEVHAEQGTEGPPAIRFEVHDTGIGIDPETLSHIFTPFMQADASTTRRFGGTGLGLAISNDLAKHLGGRLLVKSERGKGSVFTLRLVIVEAGATGAPPASDSERPLAGVRVLLAEDGADNRRLLTHLLRSAGAETETACDGLEACNRVEHADHPFDVIFMDMQMPELDGLGAVRRLRAARCYTPIVALTANNRPNDRDRCLDAGCDAYLVKPIDRQRLIAECLRWKHEGRGGLPGGRAAA